jgi:uncharacterized protein with von Willebrand factor type A (vWA) domain
VPDVVVREPFGGEEVSGTALLAQSIAFGRELRAAGLSIDLAASVDFARALGLVDIGEREQVNAAGAAIFVRRRDDLEPYDRVFARFWRRRRSRRTLPDEGPAMPRPEEDGEAGEGEDGAVEGSARHQPDIAGIPTPVPGGSDEEADDEPVEGITVAPDAYSAGEVLRHRDFDRMTPAELRDAERLVDLLEPRLELRRTRRYELHAHGRRLAPRAMFRRNLATGGQLTEWVWRRQRRHPRPLVVLCDISGSMERHSRLLLRFVQALSVSSAVKVESFVFGTRLTRVTRILRDRDRDRALARVSASVNDWAGGTRIGESFREFNLRWARRTLRSSGVVIVVSDGWDRGDPLLVASETARLRRNCHRLVWLNPLAGTPGYEPLAAGMRAAYPFIDDFLPAGTVASLERLGEILAGVRRPVLVPAGLAERPHEGHAALAAGSSSARVQSAPAAMNARAADPTVARPLR